MNKLLTFLFGKGTRGVQTFNYAINTVWLALLAMHLAGEIVLDVPTPVQDHISFLFIGALIVQTTSTIGFLSSGYKHQLMKAFALLANALLQLIVAVSYVTEYPPFEITIIVNTSFAIWFTLAVLYIANVEGLRDDGID